MLIQFGAEDNVANLRNIYYSQQHTRLIQNRDVYKRQPRIHHLHQPEQAEPRDATTGKEELRHQHEHPCRNAGKQKGEELHLDLKQRQLGHEEPHPHESEEGRTKSEEFNGFAGFILKY